MYECILYYCILFIDMDYEECYGSKYTNSQYFMRQVEFLLASFPPTKAQSPLLWIQKLMLYFTSVHWVCLLWIERPSTENPFFPLSLIIRNITEISQRQQMDREAAPSSPRCSRAEASEKLSEIASSGISPATNEKPTQSIHPRD